MQPDDDIANEFIEVKTPIREEKANLTRAGFLRLHQHAKSLNVRFRDLARKKS